MTVHLAGWRIDVCIKYARGTRKVPIDLKAGDHSKISHIGSVLYLHIRITAQTIWIENRKISMRNRSIHRKLFGLCGRTSVYTGNRQGYGIHCRSKIFMRRIF